MPAPSLPVTTVGPSGRGVPAHANRGRTRCAPQHRRAGPDGRPRTNIAAEPAEKPRSYHFYSGRNKESILTEEMSYRKLAAARLPALADMKHFVNLTNGIEAIPVLAQLGVASYGYVRIQSTLCEQNNMMGLVEALDDNLMMHLALGHTCCLWDLGSRNKKRAIPRAQWYGAEFIRWYLSRNWFGEEHVPEIWLRGNPAEHEFRAHYRSFPKNLRKKARYYRKFLAPGLDEVRLVSAYSHDATEHDHDDSWYAGRAREGLVARDATVPALEIEDALAPHGYRLFLGGWSKRERASLRRELFGDAAEGSSREDGDEESGDGRAYEGEGGGPGSDAETEAMSDTGAESDVEAGAGAGTAGSPA